MEKGQLGDWKTVWPQRTLRFVRRSRFVHPSRSSPFFMWAAVSKMWENRSSLISTLCKLRPSFNTTNINLTHHRREMEEHCTPDSNGSVSPTTHIQSFSQCLILLPPTIVTLSPKSACIVLWLKMHKALCFISTSPCDFMALYMMKYRVTFTFYLYIMVYAVSYWNS